MITNLCRHQVALCKRQLVAGAVVELVARRERDEVRVAVTPTTLSHLYADIVDPETTVRVTLQP